MRPQSILAAVLATLVPLSTIQGALAQSEPPPPPPGAEQQPPNYTPPPPPPGSGYSAQPGYGPPNGPPAPPRGRMRAPGGAGIRFEPDEPDLQLLAADGAMPVERFHYHRGWWGGGWGYHYGWAPTYAPLCDQACSTQLAPGAYHLALSKNGGRVVPAYGPVVLNGPSLVRASYVDRSGLRVAGWVIGIAGLVGGIVMIAESASEGPCNPDPDGFCDRHETLNAPLFVGGIGVLIASGIVGGVLAAQHDEAHFSVEPLRLSSFGQMRESLAAMGAEARPQGAALALHF